jgi:hypothetical protein
MTVADIKDTYGGAVLPTKAGKWTVAVTGAASSRYLLGYEFTARFDTESPTHAITNVTVVVESPSMWPPAKVMKAVVDRISAGKLTNNSEIILR